MSSRKYGRQANPTTSASQYGLMQAVASGATKVKGISQHIAEEMIKATPKGVRSRFARELASKRKSNPNVFQRDGKWWFKSVMGEVGPFNSEGAAWRRGWGSFRETKDKMHNGVIDDLLDTETMQGIKHTMEYGMYRHKTNPDGDMSGVEEMSEKFHGRKPIETIDVDEVETFDGAMIALGDLTEMDVEGTDGKSEITISFKVDRPKLCCDAEGQNLEIIGGDQVLEIEMDGKRARTVPIGYVTSICYETDKHHLDDSDGEMAEYQHEFGEEGGELPLLVYDVVDAKLMLVGGSYTIEDVGIRN